MNNIIESAAHQNSSPLSQFARVNHHRTGLTAVAAVVLAITGCSTTGGLSELEVADDFEIIDASYSTPNKFSKRVYGSVGMGASRLEPDTSANSSFDVNDRVEPAGQITLGADLTKTFSVEVHSTDLGSAGLSPAGRISYQLNGGSALLYAGGNRKSRSGFSGYGRVGIGAMDNSAIGDVPFQRTNDTQVLVGAGAEYGWRNGIGVRGEVIVFDKDAQFAQLGVVYRVGGSSSGGLAEAPIGLTAAVAEAVAQQQPPTTLIEPPPTTLIEPPTELLAEPLPAAAAPGEDTLAKYTSDTDQDGIFDTLDDCPASATGVAVDEAGCALFNGVIDGVNFERGSALLSANARNVLDSVVSTLTDQPDALIAIGAHTDSNGDDNSNMALSRERAISVAKYLINRGVPKNLMSARAFGELVPLADNQSSEGRALNRRVELVASAGVAQ